VGRQVHQEQEVLQVQVELLATQEVLVHQEPTVQEV
jgi:hypothetical protein